MKRNLILAISGILVMTVLIGYGCFMFVKSYNENKKTGLTETIEITSGAVKTNYNFIPLSNNPSLKGAYSISKVDINDIENEVILSVIFTNININSQIDKTMVDSNAKIIYGQDYNVNHGSFDNFINEKKCIYENFSYRCSSFVMDKYYVLREAYKAEQINDEMYIYDKVIFAKYETNEYNNKSLIIWKPNTDNKRTFTTEEVSNIYGNYDVIKYPSQLIEKNESYQTLYKHIFKSRGDGSFYYLSSEPIN